MTGGGGIRPGGRVAAGVVAVVAAVVSGCGPVDPDAGGERVPAAGTAAEGGLPPQVVARLAAVDARALPPPVTPTLVRAGAAVFHAVGGCHVCHAADGTGARGVGADLTDDEWWHADGSYPSLVRRIDAGVAQSAARNRWGAAMPPRGGRPLTDDDVRAVAAYVWALRLDPG